MNAARRWQDWVILLLGAWLTVAPFILPYVSGAAAWNSYLTGSAVIILAATAIVRPAQWEEWVNFTFAVWLLLSPWVLLFHQDQTATWNHIVVGLAVGAHALAAMNVADRRIPG